MSACGTRALKDSGASPTAPSVRRRSTGAPSKRRKASSSRLMAAPGVCRYPCGVTMLRLPATGGRSSRHRDEWFAKRRGEGTTKLSGSSSNAWPGNWRVSPAGRGSVVFLYTGDHFNMLVRPVLWRELKVGSHIVSHRFGMGDWEPDKTIWAGDAACTNCTLKLSPRRSSAGSAGNRAVSLRRARRDQKLKVTLNRANRGFSTVVGDSHVAPLVTGSYVWL